MPLTNYPNLKTAIEQLRQRGYEARFYVQNGKVCTPRHGEGMPAGYIRLHELHRYKTGELKSTTVYALSTLEGEQGLLIYRYDIADSLAVPCTMARVPVVRMASAS